MRLTVLQCQLNAAKVTALDPYGPSGVTLDSLWLQALGLVAYQHVRLLTADGTARSLPVVAGPERSSELKITGPLARGIVVGDHVTLEAYCEIDAASVGAYRPVVLGG